MPVDIPGPCGPRDNENAANTMRVTAIVWIRFSHVDVSRNGWDKDEKADTSETIITERRREERRRMEKRKEKKRKEKKRKEKKRKGKERKGKEKQREQRQSKGLS